jgi:hypothetical protein
MSIFKTTTAFALRAIALSALLLSACIQPIEQQSMMPVKIVSEHLHAFNAGDVDGMATMQHPDIEWLSVNGNSITVEVAGRDALSKNMAEYFQSPTKVTGSLRDWSVNDPYVSVTETASWTAKDGTQKSQSSMTVYELEDNLIRRVWYYPAVDN